jgi:hypothetical protein
VRQIYTPPGTDAAKTHSSVEGDAVVHNHSADEKCGTWEHALYRNGNKVEEWGSRGAEHNPRGD